jgi:hypothetical protein
MAEQVKLPIPVIPAIPGAAYTTTAIKSKEIGRERNTRIYGDAFR